MFKRFMKAMSSLHKDERGMTGLETAIILIAFVTVSAVFGYSVLSAGLFSAERGKETIYAGLKTAQSNMEVSGSVIATSNNATVNNILITVKNAVAGQPIDLTPCDGTANATNKCVISLSTAKDFLNNIKWTKSAIGSADSDNLLEVGEQFEITINTADLGTGKALTTPLEANSDFSIQIKPSIGSTITIKRTLPSAIDPVMDLH
jgi:flagellin FlaB